MIRSFRDRAHAGQLLAQRLARYRDASDTTIMALPRGGVVVAAEIASALHLPMDVCIVRKLGVPWQPELAMGAIAAGGVEVLHRDVISDLGVSMEDIDRELAAEREELERREHAYRGKRPFPRLAGKTVIVVDDGIATGATAEAAMKALRQGGAKRIVLAVGVAPPSTVMRLAREADEVVAAIEPESMMAISQWFDSFEQVTDDQVKALLAQPEPNHANAA
jgi:putative phosphoribosyl transferase